MNDYTPPSYNANPNYNSSRTPVKTMMVLTLWCIALYSNFTTTDKYTEFPIIFTQTFVLLRLEAELNFLLILTVLKNFRNLGQDEIPTPYSYLQVLYLCWWTSLEYYYSHRLEIKKKKIKRRNKKIWTKTNIQQEIKYWVQFF